MPFQAPIPCTPPNVPVAEFESPLADLATIFPKLVDYFSMLFEL